MSNRKTQPIKTLSTVLLAALALFVSPVAFAQESARDRVNALRGHLAEMESTYAGSLADASANKTATIKVDRLRVDLRTKLETLFVALLPVRQLTLNHPTA